MTAFNPADVNRDAHGKFAPGSTGVTSPDVLDDDVTISIGPRGSGADQIEYFRTSHSDGSYVEYGDDEYGSRFAQHYDAQNRLHRDGGPAVVSDVAVEWYQHGVLARDVDEGPASIYSDGTVSYSDFGIRASPGRDTIEPHGVSRVTRRNPNGAQQTYFYYPGTQFGDQVDYGDTNEDTHPDNRLDDFGPTEKYFHEHDPEWVTGQGTLNP